MTINDVYKVGLTSWLNSQLGLNVRYYQVTATGGFGISDSTLAEGIYAILGPLLADCESADSEILGVAVRNLTQVPLTAFAISSGAALAGSVTGNELPTQTCGIITLGTGLMGRANRGRIYVPFPAIADQDVDARPDASYMTALVALAVGLIAPITVTSGGNSATVNPVIVNRALTSVKPILDATSRRAWATQRSRGTYGATNPRVIAAV